MEISIPDRNNQLVDINGNSYFYFCPATRICLLEKQPCAQQTKTRETIIIQYYRHITPFVLQPITYRCKHLILIIWLFHLLLLSTSGTYFGPEKRRRPILGDILIVSETTDTARFRGY